MPAKPPDRSRLAPLIGVSASALVFAVLLVLVRINWPPLESVDHGLAAKLNSLVAGDGALVTVVKVVTWLGSGGVLWTVIVASALILALRRLYRLAAFVVVTGAGALVLDPVLKSLVGRLRPVVEHPVAHGNGNSFPSGHSLGSIVCYGAVLLAFLPAVSPRLRTPVRAAVGTLIGLIGLSRLLLGVHYLSDVIAAWALGVAWLGLTTYAFEIVRRDQGQPVTAPLAEGLEPESAEDLAPADPEPVSTRGHMGRVAAALVVAWVLIVGAVIGIGELVARYDGNIPGDRSIPRWFAEHRTPTLNNWSSVASTLGATQAVLIVSIATCVIVIALRRRWRPVIFVATLMVGEITAFLVASTVVKRPRPAVPTMDPHLPTFAYPSGHIAATFCIYVAVAVLVIGHTRSRWRWLVLIPASVVPIAVTVSRLYRGEHHPTDALGSLVFVTAWTLATYLLIRPNADGDEGRPYRGAIEPRHDKPDRDETSQAQSNQNNVDPDQAVTR